MRGRRVATRSCARQGTVMRVTLRADASIPIGSGHVMRCLTLADRLRAVGAKTLFLCRPLEGHLGEWITARGHALAWVEAETPAEDARACGALMQDKALWDWLIVDHYELGSDWERRARGWARHILAIDDLGRTHAADVILDQNYPNPLHMRYSASKRRLLGPKYALLRPEFARLRSESLARRTGELHRILLFMSGTDPMNETIKALLGFAGLAREELYLDVVVGASHPQKERIAALCAAIPRVTLHVQTAQMAELMLVADCALGAAGSATWERCSLGLPALVTVLAENQEVIARALDALGAHRVLGAAGNLTTEDYTRALAALTPETLRRMAMVSARICDGRGVDRVIEVFKEM